MRSPALLSIAFAAVATLLIVQPGGTGAQSITIEAGNNYFCAPSFQNEVCEQTVTVGSTVTWEVSAGIHTVTECDASFTTCPPGGGFDSDLLQSGQTYQQTFNTPGQVPYRCTFHPDEMRGLITVQAQTTGTPTQTPIIVTPGPTSTPVVFVNGPGATPTPGIVPASGGEAAGASGWPLTLLAAGSLSLLAGAVSVFLLRRRSD